MKDIDIKKSFFEKFKTLSSKYFSTNYANINFNNNKKFTIPDNKQFFNINMFVNSPEQIGVLSDGKNERLTGFFQVDVCVPKDVGEDGADKTAIDIYKLFRVGTTFGDATVTDCYRATNSVEDTFYKQVIRISFDADIVNE